MGIGRRPLGRLRRLTPDEDTHSKGVLANRSFPGGILQAAVPSSYRSGGKCAVLVGRFHAPSFYDFMPGGVKMPLTLFTSEPVLRASSCRTNYKCITPNQTAPTPGSEEQPPHSGKYLHSKVSTHKCLASYSVFWKGTIFLLFIVYLPTCSHFTAV